MNTVNKRFVLEKFCAEKFVDSLFNEGTKCICDETVIYPKNKALPEFYNKILFNKGQKFFKNNIFALLFSKFLGLLTILSQQSALRVLMYTKQSGSFFTAYKRYLSTVFHMIIWYQDDFQPDSKLWLSLLEVRKKHNLASKRCFLDGIGQISQKDMAVTQFGFMGYAVLKRQQIGLYNIAEEDLKAFVHVWRVIGFLLGMEDRFNICRDSLDETTEICKLLAQHFKTDVEKKDKNFIEMATYLSNGMWSMNPTLNTKIYLNIAYKLLQNSPHFVSLKNDQLLFQMNFLEEFFLQFLLCVIWCLRFKILKCFFNYQQIVAVWLMRVFPFLAYYQFGYTNSHVKILENNIRLC